VTVPVSVPDWEREMDGEEVKVLVGDAPTVREAVCEAVRVDE
jgi:hypothetical protein